MAKTSSTMLPLGTKAPGFTLIDTVTNLHYSLVKEKVEKGVVIMFICNHCPFVIHVNDELVRIANDYRTQGFTFIAISSNDVTKYPQDGPQRMRQVARENNYTFPYLYDETQEVAKAYHAACTPDFFVFNSELALIYRGQLDDSRPGNGIAVSGRDLRSALDAVLRNSSVSPNQKPSIGCNIKWK
ncbi:thioredoxin family protein [Aquimarina sp. W85]|uniref:thioredoxin family protein n=1 Tax=Aquimarina rhodophyticola TaxID=3342246 RepID=UPI00366AC7D3